MKSYQEFFADLQRRHVFRVATLYGGAAFVLLQVVDLLAEGLQLPPIFLTVVTVLTLIGFPIALFIAWAFEFTPDGVQRTEAASADEIATILAAPASKRWPAGLLALSGTFALLGGVWWVGLEMGRSASVAQAAAERIDGLDLAYDIADDPRPSVAVLPFADLSPEGDQEYFSDGMTEEIFGTLAGVHDVRLSGRTSSFAYKGENRDLREIGEELGVQYLVEGSVRRAGDQLRINAVLIEAANGSRLWAETFNREYADVFAIQTEIAEAVVEALTSSIDFGDDLRRATMLTDLEAYDLYLAARAATRDRGPRLVEAVALLEEVIERDSTWAPAWAALAEAVELTGWYPGAIPDGLTQREYIPSAMAEAERAATRALELDPGNATAHVALANVLRNRAEWEEAEALYQRALAIDPDNPDAHQQYAEYLLNVGRIAEAVRRMDRAAMLDPAPIRYAMLAYALRADGRPADVVEVYEHVLTLRLVPELRRLHSLQLATQYILLERWDDALGAVDAANEAGAAPVRVEERKAIIEALRAGDPSLIPPEAEGLVHPLQWALLGRAELAATGVLAFLEGRSPYGRVVELRFPSSAPIRSDPRVIEYLAERGFTGDEEVRTPPGERTRPASLRLAAAP